MIIRLRYLLVFLAASYGLMGQSDISGQRIKAQRLSDEGAFEAAAGIFREIADFWADQNQTDSVFYYHYREANQFSNAYQYEKAAELFEELLGRMSTQPSPPSFLGEVYYRTGSNYLYLNQFEAALKYLNACLAFESGRSEPKRLNIAQATEWKGLTYSYLGELDKARDYIQDALDIRRELLEKDAKEIGYNLNSLGLIYFELNDLEKADASFSEALRILSLHLPAHHAHLASLSSNISSIKSSLGDFHTSRQLLEQSIEAHLAEERFYPLIDEYFNLGSLLLSLDDHEHALPYIRTALSLADSLLPYPHYTRTNMLDGLGGTYYATAAYLKADSIFRLALSEKLMLFNADHPEVGRSYYSLGMIAKETGAYIQARNYFNRSLEIRRKSLGHDHPGTADALLGLGELDWLLEDRSAAIGKFQNCLAVYEKKLGITNQSYIQATLRLAQFYDRMDRPDSVAYYLRSSWSGVLGTARENIHWDDRSIPTIRFVDSYVLNLIAFHLHQLNRRKEIAPEKKLLEGKQLLDLSDQLLGEILPLVHFEKTNQNLISLIRQIYGEGLLLAQSGIAFQPEHTEWEELLLYCLEQSRAISIRFALQNRQAMQFANVPDTIVEQDRRLREQLRFIQAQSGEESRRQTLLFSKMESWRNFQGQLQASYPQWYALRYAQPQIEMTQIEEELALEDATLLSYFDLDSSLFVLIMNEQGLKTITLPVPEGWQDSIQIYRQLIERQGDKRRIGALAHTLYRYLWEPVAKELKESVIVIPDGALCYLNFETLLSEPPKTDGYDSWPWLIRDYTIYLRNKLPVKSRRARPGSSAVLGIAPGFDRELKSQYLRDLPPGQAPDTVFTSWLRTPWSIAFVEQLGRKGRSLTGSEATKQAFLTLAPESGILHFGTHAQLKDEAPMLSYFALTPQPETGDAGYLYAYELYNLPLQAQLTVLTACQTGLGTYLPGQGVLSLAHAFQYAGCPSVIYSLWSIDDQQSNQLMTSFYRHLDDGISFAPALREAKLDYLEQHSGALAAPYYWGGLVLMGDNTQAAASQWSAVPYWWMLLLVGLGLLVLIFWRKK